MFRFNLSKKGRFNKKVYLKIINNLPKNGKFIKKVYLKIVDK